MTFPNPALRGSIVSRGISSVKKSAPQRRGGVVLKSLPDEAALLFPL